jgi:hypothetical protein
VTRTKGLVLLAACCALVTACSTPVEGSSAVPPPPSPDPFTSALIMTRTWAAAEIDVTAETTINDVSVKRHGVGEVAIDKGYADIDWTTADTHGHELVNDRAIFTQDAPGDIWVRTESSGRTPTSAFADPLLHLTDLHEVAPDGTAEIDGFEAEKYRGTLPVTAGDLEGLALTDADIAQIVEVASPSDSIIVTVWVDPHHRAVRIDRSLQIAGAVPISATATTHLTNFGVMLDLESPPSASVVTARRP